MSEKTGTLHHIEIYVSNLTKTKLFWGELLESLSYTIYQKWDQGISWKLDKTYIVFVQTRRKYLDIPYNRCGTGLNHIAFHVNSKKQLDNLANSLERKGIKFLYNNKFRKEKTEDPYSIFFEDPDRIKVELVYSG